MRNVPSPTEQEWLIFEQSLEQHRVREALSYDIDIKDFREGQERILRTNNYRRKEAGTKVLVGYGFGVISLLASFGIAKLASESAPNTITTFVAGVALGTAYVAVKEYSEGQDIIDAADLSDMQALEIID